MKHSTGRNNDHCTDKKDNTSGMIKLAGETKTSPTTKKPFKLAGAKPVVGEGKKARKKG